MTRLFMMQREFVGHSWVVSAMLEDSDFRDSLVYDDSWYFLHYCLFGRDSICSEDSEVLRTHLYNLVSSFYAHFEKFAEDNEREEQIKMIIKELLEMAEYSENFSITVWSYGDETAKAILEERLEELPSEKETANLMGLPHFFRGDQDRLPYRYKDAKSALKRMRRAEAGYNKRKKQAK